MTLRRGHAAAVAGIIALVVFLPALRNGFAYDDVAVIQGDPRVHSLDHVYEIFSRGYWADAELALYRPVTTLTFAIDWTLSGGSPAWFMFMNAVWHALASVLVCLVLARIVPVSAALAGALVFAVHPVHVEAVANAVGRADVMAAAFCLAALLAWPRLGGGRTRHVVITTGLLALALLTKESTIMLPALLVLLDAARGDLTPHNVRIWLRARILPLAALAAVAVVYLTVRVVVLGGLAPARLDAALEVTSGADRIFTALLAWPHYARLLLFPSVLLADYGPRIIMPATSITPMVAAGGAILLGLLVGGVVAWWKGNGRLALALLWFPVAILPVSNLIVPIGIIVAERTLYLPSLAIAVTTALLVVRSGSVRHVRVGAVAGLVCVLLLLTVRTVTRIPDWRSTDIIFAALLRDRPDSFRAHWHHARIDAVAGRPEEALRRYVHALEIWPYRRRLVLEAARASIRADNLQYARGLGRFAHERWPDDPESARMYAAATLDLGDTLAARSIIMGALQSIPGDSLLLRMQSAIDHRTK